MEDKEDSFLSKISNDDAIFHYTRRATALEKILSKNCFKFSSFMNANDPDEYNSKIYGANGWSRKDDGVIRTCNLIDKLISKNTSYISCCSNTIKNNKLESCGWEKPRMWAQYGENQEGICLVLSKEKLKKLIEENFNKDEYLIYHYDVIYKENMNNSSAAYLNFDDSAFVGITPIDKAIEHIETHHKDLLFSKQDDWIGEQEYRTILLRKKDKIDFLSVPKFNIRECLLGVILGDRFPDVYIPVIEKICKDPKISHGKLIWVKGKYNLLELG